MAHSRTRLSRTTFRPGLKRIRDAISAVILISLSAALLWLTIHNFIIRFVTDQRYAIKREVIGEFLAAAHRLIPDSPRINLKIAELSLSEVASDNLALTKALTHAERASLFSLWDYRTFEILGNLRELQGDSDGAESALRASVRLAPGYPAPSWHYGNFLLRIGKTSQAMAPLRAATTSGVDLYPQTYDLLWRLSGGNFALLKEFAANSPTARMSLVTFLLDQSQTEDAVSLWQSMDRESLMANSTGTAQLINRLIESGKQDTARRLWLSLANGFSSGGELISNGSFEAEADTNFSHFDWQLTPSADARVTIDPSFARSGSHSLQIAFTGRDTTRLNKEVVQWLALRPGERYRLEVHVATRGLVTPHGPVVAIFDGAKIVATSQAVMPGEQGRWVPFLIDFTAPAKPGSLRLSIVRTPLFSYDDPTTGVVWFDDFSLKPLGERSPTERPSIVAGE